MARIFNQLTLKILESLQQMPKILSKSLYEKFKGDCDYKEFYNTLFRLTEAGLVKKEKTAGDLSFAISEEGEKILQRKNPKRDGVWKLIIFDIPEKQKYVRTVLRAKLKTLHFKKWQNSIYVSPFEMDAEIEAELKSLAKRFFVRLIKTTDINDTADLDKMF